MRSPNIIPVSDVRRRLTALLGELDDPVYITQHGRLAGVLVSPEQWDELWEEMEDLRRACDPEWQAEVARVREMCKDQESIRAAEARGDLIPLEQLEAELDQLEDTGQDGDVPD